MNLFTRLRLLAVLAGALIVLPAQAGLTNIAKVPLLNMTGTGSVKPNLMLLFDDSGSMDFHFLPDALGYGNTYQCRGRAALRDGGNTLCSPGHPPFNASDFNQLYYNPATRYRPPVKYDGSYYPEMTSWTAVPMDGFKSRGVNLYGANTNNVNSTTNLETGFPDLAWCDSDKATNCRRNTATYTYPDATFRYPSQALSAPYYYNIRVAQYCSDKNLTKCVSTSVGAAAPDGYPFAVKVRWCDTVNLNNCQAKQLGNFKYPSFSTPRGAVVSFGTIAINASATARSLQITGVTIPDPTTPRTITNAAVTAPNGTDTAIKQQTLASLLAASIMAKTGLTNQYWACVRTPLGTTTVLPCASYGIDLDVDNVVAVIPLDCATTGNKSASNCSPALDASAAGWGITVAAPTISFVAAPKVPPTALIAVSGTSAASGTPNIASIKMGATTLASNIKPGTSKSAAAIATSIIGAINGVNSGYTAYPAGNTITPTCANTAAADKTLLCVVDNNGSSNGVSPVVSTLSNVSFSVTASDGYAPVKNASDAIAVQTAAIQPGSAPASTFERVDIVPTNNSYPKAAGRTDCAGATCSYSEEMTNFANWYAYYKSRIQMTKTAVGLAFAPVTGNFRIGLAKMSVTAAGGAIEVLPADFTSTNRQAWYKAFYATVVGGSTPTRPALDNLGRMFANQDPYKYPSGSEVVQYPCQQNFIMLTTDGYWNQDYTGPVLSNDNKENPSRFCTVAGGCTDASSQAKASLADIALYWYNGGSNTSTISLRPDIDDVSKKGLVPIKAGENSHLHVNTYALALGIDGAMNYEENYDKEPKAGGDFANLINRVQTGCPWNGGGAYVWPDPKVTDSTSSTIYERVDDLWHAAINGRGKYFSASDPAGVQKGLSEALEGITVRVGAASAAATSTPNVSVDDNNIFTDTFTTGKWFGELSDKKIDLTNGVVGSTVEWTTNDTLGAKVDAASDDRKIKMLNIADDSLKNFKYAEMNAVEKAWFDNKCNQLAQCGMLPDADKALVNQGNTIVNWLRGQQQYADDRLLRAYSKTTTKAGTVQPIVLGDIASSKPAFMRAATKSYATAGYAKFKSETADPVTGRKPTVFTAANDGMLHAFDARNGDELWAYVPRIIMKKLHKQASTNYSANHQFTADGSPELGDVQIGTKWRTVLVAGLNGGGRGYYALDVTDPANPTALWEFCADETVCPKHHDNDIGLTFGNPQFGQWQGNWVVFLTSGYNNVSGVDDVNTGTSGHGFLYVLDVATGTLLAKIDTAKGLPDTPSTPVGLSKITSISSNPFTDPVTTYVYGGDNSGKMYRFDFTLPGKLAYEVKLMGDAGVNQPITTRPEVTQCLETDVINGAATSHAQRVVIFGTGRLLDLPDIADNANFQSVYMLKDKGSAIDNIRGASMVQQSLSILKSERDPNAPADSDDPANASVNIDTYTITAKPVDLATKDGWYVDLTLNKGERINLDPLIIDGGVNVVSTEPTSSSSCKVGGSSNVYQFKVCTGSYVGTDTVVGSTLSNTAAAVGFIVVRLPSGSIKMIATLADGTTTTGSISPPNSKEMRKVGWRTIVGE